MNRMKLYYANHGPDLTDYGPEPFVTNIDRAVKQNYNYRTALWTGRHLQLTLMSIPPGGDIGLEKHPHLDQFIRIEDGFGLVMMGASKEKLNYQKDVCAGYAVFVPADTWHNIVNTGNRPIKLYSVYSPPEHPHGTIQASKQDDEHDEQQQDYIESKEPVIRQEVVMQDEFIAQEPCVECADCKECGECGECEECDECDEACRHEGACDC